MEKRIYLSPPHMSGEEWEFVSNAFDANWIAPAGPDIDAFEKEMCTYTGATNAVALSSGTSALHLSLIVSGISTKHDIYCSSFTFAGSAFPITYLGARPVFIDSELKSWNMDPDLLEKAIQNSLAEKRIPGAVIAVHLYGQSADLIAIKNICDKYNVVLIEDAAESLGTLNREVHTGTIGDYGIYSFNGNKIITTSGGGMLVGKDYEKIKMARYLSTQAREPLPFYHHLKIGYNYRMSNVCAAIGRGQLRVIDQRVKKKRAIYEFYKKNLKSDGKLSIIPRDAFGKSNCWLTCILLDERIRTSPEDIRLILEEQNIESRPLWKPMHLQPVFSHCPAYCNGNSKRLFERGLCLPSGSSITENEQCKVIEAIGKIIDHNN